MSRKRKDRKIEEKAGEEYPKKCPECGSKIVTGNGEFYCDSCGLVIAENVVDLGQEWRAYNEEQNSKRMRTGPPMTYQIYDKGLNLPHSFPTRTNTGVKSTNEISITFALSEIGRMASALGLPIDIKEDASLLYREAIHKSIKGRSIEAITSAIIYIVCRQYGVPRTLEEIKQVSWENKERKIYKAVNYLTQKLELKIPPASPRDFVFRFCSWLDLSIKTRAEVWEMANRDFNGRTPTGIAAAAIYIITESAESNNEHRTKKKIAEITGVSIPTILKGTKEVSKQLENIPN